MLTLILTLRKSSRYTFSSLKQITRMMTQPFVHCLFASNKQCTLLRRVNHNPKCNAPILISEKKNNNNIKLLINPTTAASSLLLLLFIITESVCSPTPQGTFPRTAWEARTQHCTQFNIQHSLSFTACSLKSP